jgi:LAO/AO transport system kinase
MRGVGEHGPYTIPFPFPYLRPVHPDELTTLAERLMAGNRVALGRAITLVESSLEQHRALAAELLQRVGQRTGQSQRIGITGVPGVGKSTFIEAFGVLLADAGRHVAVLAVDPSSNLGRGSILGDKTRMEQLAAHPNAFIRPTPSGGSLGGVARRTKETIALCEAAGYDTILIETVGVGQSETAVHAMVDMFVLLVLASAGDELQGIKRGIMEMADLIVITKDDGSNAHYTATAKASYHHALHLFPAKESGWTVPVVSCSALESKGVDTVAAKVEEYFRHITLNGHLNHQRQQQNVLWLEKALHEELLHHFMAQPQIKERLSAMQLAVSNGEVSPFEAAHLLIAAWRTTT